MGCFDLWSLSVARLRSAHWPLCSVVQNRPSPRHHEHKGCLGGYMEMCRCQTHKSALKWRFVGSFTARTVRIVRVFSPHDLCSTPTLTIVAGSSESRRTEPVCSCHTHAYGLSWSRFYFFHLSSSSFPTERLCTCPGAVGISQPENDKVTKVKYMCGKHRNTVFPYFVQIRGPHQNDAIFTGKLLTMLFSLSLFV